MSFPARERLVRHAACFFGVAAFFAIGLSYLALALLLLAMLLDRSAWPARWQRLRTSPNWRVSWLFVGWIAVVLLLQPRYPESASNVTHALRMVITLSLVLTFSAEEAIFAVRGFVAGLLLGLGIIAANQLVDLPDWPFWYHLLAYDGNRSIGNAILMALAAAGIPFLAPRMRGRQRAAAYVIELALLAVLIFVLPSRTAWLVLIAGWALGSLHRARAGRPSYLAILAGGLVVAVVLGAFVPQVKHRVWSGISDVTTVLDRPESVLTSWGQRYEMYTKTAEMIRERPLAGWGMGAWNTLWRERADPAIAELNMPHNDFLWIGSQAGLPGMLAFLLLIFAGVPASLRRRDLGGCLAFIALTSLFVAVCFNSALRDASIGLSLLFVVFLFQRLSTDPGAAWSGILPAPWRSGAEAPRAVQEQPGV